MDQENESGRGSPFRVAALVVGVAVVYVASARLGLLLAFEGSSASLVWPPTGIALAALLLLGFRVLPGIVLGAFVANLWSSGWFLFSVGATIGNTLEALVGAYLLQRLVGFHNALDRVKDVVGLVGFAAIFSTTISASLGVLSLSLGGAIDWAEFGSTWFDWWMGDAMGVVIVAPVLLTGAHMPWRRWSRAQQVEALALFAGLAVITYIDFIASAPFIEITWPLAYAIYPFLIWAALRFGPPGASVAVLLSAFVAIFGTARGAGPFAVGTPYDNLIQLLFFMAMLALTALILAAVIAERNQAKHDLHTLNEGLERSIDDRTAALAQEVEDRSEAEEALRAALARAEALHHLSHSVIHVERLPEVLQAVVDSVAEALPADRVTLFNFNLKKKQVLRAVKGGPGLSNVADVAFDELMDGLSGWVLRHNRPALSPKDVPDPRESPAVQQRRADTHCGAIIVAPLRYRDQTVGTMTAINRPDQRDFTRADVELMMTMANQATVAIENVRLLDSLKIRQARMRLLYEVTSQTSRDLDEQLREALRRTTLLLGMEIGILSRITGDAYVVEHCYAPDADLAPGQRFDLGQTYCRITLEADDVVAVDHMKHSEHHRHPCYETFQLESYIGIPVYLDEERYGTLNFSRAQPKEPVFNAADRETMYLLRQWVAATLSRKQAEQALAEKAEELARSKTELEQFAYMASHDLQEPLRTINSFVKLLEKRYTGQLDEDADSFIGFIVDGSVRMQALIRDLLALSRVGRRTLEPEPIDVNAVLARTITGMQVILADAEAEVTHDTLPTVEADATQMSLLLQNLISNAVKFHGEAPPRVHVSAHHQNGAWTFAVKDNGIGIKADLHERIFEVFRRLHSRSKYAGTGMGLALCKKIVERHGGRIWVESEEGQGSTFFFTLPERTA